MNDIEIAQNAHLDPIDQIGKKVGLTENELEMYGKYKAKVNVIEKHRLNSKLVLVTAVNPTPCRRRKIYRYYRIRRCIESIRQKNNDLFA